MSTDLSQCIICTAMVIKNWLLRLYACVLYFTCIVTKWALRKIFRWWNVVLDSTLKKLELMYFCMRPLYLACPTCSNKQYCMSDSGTFGSQSNPRMAFSLTSWEATITRQSPHLQKLKIKISTQSHWVSSHQHF